MLLDNEMGNWIMIDNKKYIIEPEYDVVDEVWFAVDNISKVFVMGNDRDEVDKFLKKAIKEHYKIKSSSDSKFEILEMI